MSEEAQVNHGAAAVRVGTGEAPKETGNWRDTLPEELRGHTALANLRDVAALAKEHVNLQTLIGRRGVIPPGDNAPPEAWDRFWNSLGRPTDPTGYQFKVPRGLSEGTYSADLAREFAQAGHRLGLTARQAEGLHDWFSGQAAAQIEAQGEAAAGRTEQLETGLRREWGAQYDRHLDSARRAMRRYAESDAIDQLEAALGSSGAPGGAAMIKMLARIGETLREDSIVGDGGAKLSLGPAEAKTEIDKVMANQNHPYWNRLNPGHRAAVAHLEHLFRVKNGV